MVILISEARKRNKWGGVKERSAFECVALGRDNEIRCE